MGVVVPDGDKEEVGAAGVGRGVLQVGVPGGVPP